MYCLYRGCDTGVVYRCVCVCVSVFWTGDVAEVVGVCR